MLTWFEIILFELFWFYTLSHVKSPASVLGSVWGKAVSGADGRSTATPILSQDLPCFLHHRDLLQSSWISSPWQLHLSPGPSCTLKHIHVSIISFLLYLPLLTSSITQCFSVSSLKGNLGSASFSPQAIPWFTASLVLGAPTWSSQQWLGKLVSVYGKQGSPRNSEVGEAMQGVCVAGFLRLGLPTTKLK